MPRIPSPYLYNRAEVGVDHSLKRSIRRGSPGRARLASGGKAGTAWLYRMREAAGVGDRRPSCGPISGGSFLIFSRFFEVFFPNLEKTFPTTRVVVSRIQDRSIGGLMETQRRTSRRQADDRSQRLMSATGGYAQSGPAPQT